MSYRLFLLQIRPYGIRNDTMLHAVATAAALIDKTSALTLGSSIHLCVPHALSTIVQVHRMQYLSTWAHLSHVNRSPRNRLLVLTTPSSYIIVTLQIQLLYYPSLVMESPTPWLLCNYRNGLRVKKISLRHPFKSPRLLSGLCWLPQMNYLGKYSKWLCHSCSTGNTWGILFTNYKANLNCWIHISY